MAINNYVIKGSGTKDIYKSRVLLVVIKGSRLDKTSYDVCNQTLWIQLSHLYHKHLWDNIATKTQTQALPSVCNNNLLMFVI